MKKLITILFLLSLPIIVSAQQTRGVIGISMGGVVNINGYNEYTKGLVVKDVLPQSAASRAGIVPGDLIVSINNSPFTTPQELKNLLDFVPGKSTNIVILRGNSLKTILVVPDAVTVPQLQNQGQGNASTSSGNVISKDMEQGRPNATSESPPLANDSSAKTTQEINKDVVADVEVKKPVPTQKIAKSNSNTDPSFIDYILTILLTSFWVGIPFILKNPGRFVQLKNAVNGAVRKK